MEQPNTFEENLPTNKLQIGRDKGVKDTSFVHINKVFPNFTSSTKDDEPLYSTTRSVRSTTQRNKCNKVHAISLTIAVFNVVMIIAIATLFILNLNKKSTSQNDSPVDKDSAANLTKTNSYILNGINDDEILHSYLEMEGQSGTSAEDELSDLLKETKSSKISSCDDTTTNGLTTIYPESFTDEGINVYCDGSSQGERWIVIQRRINGSVDFYRTYDYYQRGFGNHITGEHWLGLETVHKLTRERPYKLLIELEDFQNETAYAEYASFSVGNSSTFYQLSVSGYKGTADDSLTYHDGMKFTTRDVDNDQWHVNCADTNLGAWWYKNCHRSNLNGKYYKRGLDRHTGIVWYYWKNSDYSLKHVSMKIRPND